MNKVFTETETSQKAQYEQVVDSKAISNTLLSPSEIELVWKQQNEEKLEVITKSSITPSTLSMTPEATPRVSSSSFESSIYVNKFETANAKQNSTYYSSEVTINDFVDLMLRNVDIELKSSNQIPFEERIKAKMLNALMYLCNKNIDIDNIEISEINRDYYTQDVYSIIYYVKQEISKFYDEFETKAYFKNSEILLLSTVYKWIL